MPTETQKSAGGTGQNTPSSEIDSAASSPYLRNAATAAPGEKVVGTSTWTTSTHCRRSSRRSSTRSGPRVCCPTSNVAGRPTRRRRRSTRRRRAPSFRRRPTRSRRRRLGGAGGRIFMITFPSALVSRGAFTALPEERSRDRSTSHAVPRRRGGRHVHVLPRTHLGRPDRSWDGQVQEMLI